MNKRIIETEECLKYEDIECQIKYELVKDSKYDSIINDIKYAGANYIVLKDNSIIPIDKNV